MVVNTLTERAEGGENHCNPTWGNVLTDRLWLQDPDSGQPAEFPYAAGNPPK